MESDIDFMSRSRMCLCLSFALMILSAICFYHQGLNLGIDFTGGSEIEIHIESDSKTEDLRKLLIDNSHKNFTVKNLESKGDFLIGIAKSEGDVATTTIKEILDKEFSKNISYKKVEYVGPQVGEQMIKSSIWAVFMSLIGILTYLSMRFEGKYGVGGIFALIHDVILTLGLFSVTGIEFDMTAIAAILTIIGYSINDSVVIFDRIRERIRNVAGDRKLDANIINEAINSTLSRTMMTSFTTLIATLSITFFGGETLFAFGASISFGVIVGTYSSIMVAPPVALLLRMQ